MRIPPAVGLTLVALVAVAAYLFTMDRNDHDTVIDYRGFTIGTRETGTWIVLRDDGARAWVWVNDPEALPPDDAIASGSNPGRAMDTAKIYADGAAP